jgi:hypothetical protein
LFGEHALVEWFSSDIPLTDEAICQIICHDPELLPEAYERMHEGSDYESHTAQDTESDVYI